MDNRINKIRKQIRALRVSMLEAEAVVHEQINRDESCAWVAAEIMAMRSVMSLLVKERAQLGDREPILVNFAFIPRRAPRPSRVVKLRPVPQVADEALGISGHRKGRGRSSIFSMIDGS